MTGDPRQEHSAGPEWYVDRPRPAAKREVVTMDERGQGIPEYASLLLLVALIGFGALIAVGPSLGGAPMEVRAALRGMIVGDDKAPVDDTVPADLSMRAVPPSGRQLSPVLPAKPIFVVALLPLRVEGAPCASFAFTGAVHIQDGRFAFNPFTVVSHTEPYGESDPLASWKLVQFEVFALDVGDMPTEVASTVTVSQAVNLAILDPFSREVLLSAHLFIAEIDVQGRTASINAGLQTNLSDIRVNNAIASDTLAAFGMDTNGVLVLRLGHTQNVGTALRGAAPLYAPVSGVVYAERCLR